MWLRMKTDLSHMPKAFVVTVILGEKISTTQEILLQTSFGI